MFPHYLDVQQISDISKVIDNNTFERPIYAGNALATVQSNEKVDVITVQYITGFEIANAESGSASIETVLVQLVI